MKCFDIKKFRGIPLPNENEIMSSWNRGLDAPIVSIVCITYNQELCIHDAIRGFLIQMSKYSFEIIIHDDASTDTTQKIIEYYMGRYPNIIKLILQKENQFSNDPNSVLAIPFKAARGKYIALCEGDDFWIEPSKLQRQTEYLEENIDFSMCIHNAIVFNRFTDSQYLFNVNKVPSIIDTKDVIVKSWFTPTASFLFRRHGINMPQHKQINGDMLILFLNSLNGKIHYSDEVMSVYNYGAPSSLSRKLNGNKLELYNKKFNFLRFVNKRTANRYIVFTSIIYIKTKMGFLLNAIGLR